VVERAHAPGVEIGGVEGAGCVEAHAGLLGAQAAGVERFDQGAVGLEMLDVAAADAREYIARLVGHVGRAVGAHRGGDRPAGGGQGTEVEHRAEGQAGQPGRHEAPGEPRVLRAHGRTPCRDLYPGGNE